MARGLAARALILAAVADAVTMLLLPPGAERNPVAAYYPTFAIVAKGCITALLLTSALGRFARGVRRFAVLAWSLGALTNILVLLEGT